MDFDCLSSSEAGAGVVCAIYWDSGEQYESDPKGDPDFVRPARAF